MPIDYFILNLHRINTIENVSAQINFSAFEWIRKNKKHKNKSIGFLFKFAKINQRKNIQIYGSKIKNWFCTLSYKNCLPVRTPGV